jgi:hypothetical protein
LTGTVDYIIDGAATSLPLIQSGITVANTAG